LSKQLRSLIEYFGVI